MRQFWSITIATFLLLGLAGVCVGAAISQKQPDVAAHGREAMVMAQYDLAMVLRR
ncbi:MAG: hypothetical protein JWR77_1987 [Rhizorhabdus sp.]|nr:hypothetical protein [Rhizorhabdus sp.]